MLKFVLSLILAICIANMTTEAKNMTLPSNTTEITELHLCQPEAFEQESLPGNVGGSVPETCTDEPEVSEQEAYNPAVYVQEVSDQEMSEPEVPEREVCESEVGDLNSTAYNETETVSYQSEEMLDADTPEAEISYGSAGRLYIPDIGITVALNWCEADASGEYLQSVVDAKDSAAYFPHGNTCLIADHSNQAFATLYAAYPGCEAYIDYYGETTTYVCAEVINGSNAVYALITEDGRDASQSEHAFITYTCLNGWQNVIIAFWDAAA